jgi:hypothetical protein
MLGADPDGRAAVLGKQTERVGARDRSAAEHSKTSAIDDGVRAEVD